MILTRFSPLLLTASLFLAACSSGDSSSNNGTPTGSDNAGCLASSMKFEETKVSPNDSQGNLFVDFDITNQSSTNYDVQTGSKPIYIDIKVTTTDGKVYDSSQILTVTSLAAGSTASSQLLGNYGSGKTYKSYTATLVCK